MERMSEIRNVLPVSLFIWAVFHLLSGCTQTEVVDGPQLPEAGKEVQATFHLNVLANRDSQTRSIAFTADGTVDTDSIPVNPKDTVVTKATTALPDAEESGIAHLWIGQYDADGSCIFNQYFSVITGNEVDVRLKDGGGKEHHIWFVANTSDLGKIETEAVLQKHVLTYSSEEDGLPSNRLCGMVGSWSGPIDEGGVENIHVDLTRLVAKISFAYLIGGTDFSFTPTSVTLNSVPDRYQIKVPVNQLTADMIYKTYNGTAGKDGATMYWYLPENMAGTVSGENAVKSDKKKTGKGVTNATYIELTGQAVQSGVTYENVRFRFYPGSNENNYDIERNSHYTMNVTLAGIDITDERITVGTIPPVEITPGNMPARVGGEKELQITARPGQPWMIKLPDWLSAQVKDKNLTVPVSGSISYQGPAQLLFKAETANPKAETRTFSFPLTITGEEQTIEIVQDGSTLEAGGSISLSAVSGSEGSSTFTATKGLPWRAVLSDGSWLTWASSNPGTGNDTATGESQNLIVKATASNPYAKERSVNITVEGGESIGSVDYHNLQKNISVTQAASTVTCPAEPVVVTAEGANAANAATSSFTATSGLSWKAAVSEVNWISLTGQTEGTTTAAPQNVTFTVPVNPNSSVRSGAINVRVGDETEGPTGTIAVQQEASVIEVVGPTEKIASAGGKVFGIITATPGLPWTINPQTDNGITINPTSGLGEATLEFSAPTNNGSALIGSFIVTVTDASPIRTANISVEQASAITEPIIGNIEVQKRDAGSARWSGASVICTSQEGGWRLPTFDELIMIRANIATLKAIEGFVDFAQKTWEYYTSSTVCEDHTNHKALNMGDGSVKTRDIESYYIRCVRDR
ncbi:BACON domain-containing protein [Parabacteroides chongii]|uniref:BACON domain-containing protein n=1 Tax=Parabacteroides chongii TaxID=2685834 RepID=UPI00240CF0B2|nr:BACON domain-containing carbohydrate-binding protein [Parabacteroides chongii]WFE83281.1 BACON domain-containing carbohydrate-binding protein [Parabacteroides chongii]